MARGFRASENSSAQAPRSSSPIQAAFEKKASKMKSKPTAATVGKFLRDNVDNPAFKKEIMAIGKFLDLMNYWQADSSSLDRGALVKRFKALPDFVRKEFSDDIKEFKGLWRGDDVIDGKDESVDDDDTVKAFSDSPGAALFFGNGIYNADDAVKAEGIINTAKILKVLGYEFTEKFNDTYGDELELADVGDDEGERIVYGIEWKKGVGSNEWALATQPARYAAARKAAEAADPKIFEEKTTLYDREGRHKFRDENGNTMTPDDGRKGMQIYDPNTGIRIRPPIELELKRRLPYVFGEMTPEEEQTYKNLDRRG